MNFVIEEYPSMRDEIPDVEGKRFLIRALAFIIDIMVVNGLTLISGFVGYVIIGILMIFVSYILGIELYFVEEENILQLIYSLIISILYFGLFEGVYGATFGKLILRMRVISSNGDPCSLLQAFDRSILRIIDGFFFGLVAYINMKPPVFQRLGDKRAGTLVVSANNPIIRKCHEWWKFILALILFLISSGLITMMFTIFDIRIS